MEPQALPETTGQDNFFCAICQNYINQLIIFPDPDGIRADRSGIGKFVQLNLNGLPESRCE
jgi:hypothetical protein